MSSRSAAAVARSARAERVLTALFGVLALLAGAAALVLGSGWLNQDLAQRPVLEPVVLDWMSANRTLTLVAGMVIGLLLVVFGLRWVFRSLRPERHPDLVLDRAASGRLTVVSGAIASAVGADAETVPGVSRASARLVGTVEQPALRLTLWLAENTDVRTLWQQLDSTVLTRARTALGIESLPTAVRLELETVARQRVR